MNLYRRFVTMLVIFALVGAGWPNARPTPAHAAGPWYVAPGGNDSNSCLSTGSPCATINGAIGKASSGDTIYVATGTYTNSAGSEVVLIDKDATLSGGWDSAFTTQGGSSTLDGQGTHKGIVNNGATAIISRFTLQNADFYAYGNGINNIGGNVTLIDCIIRRNGAISSQFGMTNGSGIYNTGMLTVTNSIVTDNTGITVYNDNGIVTLINSAITDNTGLGIYTSGGALVLNTSAVSGNTNGGINSYSPVTLTNSTVHDNTGGGIFNNAMLVLNNSTVSGNIAGEYGAGGISNITGASVITLSNSTVTGNSSQSEYYSGGIFNGAGILSLQNSIVTGNTNPVSGPDCNGDGTINSLGYNLIGDTTGCTFTPAVGDLTNVNANLGELLGSPGYHPLLPGSPAINAGNPAGCTDHLGNPLPTDQRGAARVSICDIGAYEYTIPGPATTLRVVSGSPQHAPPLTAFALPLRIAVLDSLGSPVSDTVVTFAAPASGASGAFAASGTYTTTAVSNSGGVLTTTFTANAVRGVYTVTATASGVLAPATFLLGNLAWYATPTGNDSLDCQTPASACVTINATLGKSEFLDGDTVFVASGTYTRNTGDEVVLVNRSVTLSGGWDSAFAAQTSLSTVDGGNARRGITVDSGLATAVVIVEYFVIQNGIAPDSAGGLYNYNNLSTVSLNNSAINDNKGGGITNKGTLTLNNSVVSDNSGTGIYNQSSFSMLTLNNTTVIGNISESGSGGIFNGGVLALNNSTVTGNAAPEYGGGGIYNAYGSMSLNNSTITGNTGQYGGGLYGSAVGTVQNSIIAGNIATVSGPDCYGGFGSSGYNLIGDTTGCTFTPAVGDLTNVNANLGELLGSPGYHPLLPGSPAINAGNPAGCTDHLGNPLPTDQRGAARVSICDIGAYEYTIPGPATTLRVVSGSPQHAPPLTAFALPLRIAVLDSLGSPVSDTVVTFAAPASGASGAFAASGTYTTTAVSNSGGVLTTTFTANAVRGVYTVTATASGVLAPATFLLGNLAWYATPTGNDSLDCQTPASACVTINATLGKSEFLDGDTVFVASGTYTRNTGDEVVLVNRSVTLSGGWDSAFAAQTSLSTVDGGNARRGITVDSGMTAVFEHFTIRNGLSNSGGGIYNDGALTLNDSAVSNNTAGGGIHNRGTLTLTNSVINSNLGNFGITNDHGSLTLNNSAVTRNTLGGGGIYNWGGLLTLNNSTISGNSGNGLANDSGTVSLNNTTISGNAGAVGGGIGNSGGTVLLQNSLVAGNTATAMGPDCSGTISSAGYNLIGNTSGCTFASGIGDLTNVSANLWYLINSPGYYPLLSGSPAIDAGNPAGCIGSAGLLTTDQRGSARPLDGDGSGNARCDIGAYELDPANPIRHIFLPIIGRSKARPGINGIVTENGVPAPGVTLDLRFFNGSSWSTLTSTTTDADGDYFFTGIPSLNPGQYYYVRYQNTVGGNPNRLWTWHTQSLTSYTAGSNVAIGNFDLANLTLLSPADGANVSVPHTFQWTSRAASPTDIYEFDLYDPYDFNPGFYPIVGYVGSYTLNSLPPGFGAGPLYVWEVWVYSPDGGFGISYETRVVYFTNTGLARPESLDLSEQGERPHDIQQRPIPVPSETWRQPHE